MIIDFKVGYMGRDITIQLDKDAPEGLENFHFINTIETLNAESLKLSSISGISHRLLYIKNGILKAKNIEGWKVIYEYDDDIYEPSKAYYFYTTETSPTGKEEERCDVFDSQRIYHYRKVHSKKGDYWAARSIKQEDGSSSYKEFHLLGEVPIIPIENNKSWTGDFSTAVSSIDEYDAVLSDLISEIKSIRGNYIVLYGMPYVDDSDPTASLRPYLKENNLIVMPVDDNGNMMGDVKTLEIQIPDEAIQNTLQNLRNHIFEESNSIDIQKITETSDARVFTIKTALMPVENNAKTTEQYFSKALRKQYRILSYFLNNSGYQSFDWKKVQFDFTRNFPSNEENKAQQLSILMNNMDPYNAYLNAGYENPEQLAEDFINNMVPIPLNEDNNA
jgi:SPP1 family phage portal protein